MTKKSKNEEKRLLGLTPACQYVLQKLCLYPKVLLRKMIPAPLLSHISAEDEDDDVKFSTTPMSVPAKKRFELN